MRNKWWPLVVVVVMLLSFTVMSLIGLIPWQQMPCIEPTLTTKIIVDGRSAVESLATESVALPVHPASEVSITAQITPDTPTCREDYSIDWEFQFQSDPISAYVVEESQVETTTIVIGSQTATEDTVVLSLRGPGTILERRYVSLEVERE